MFLLLVFLLFHLFDNWLRLWKLLTTKTYWSLRFFKRIFHYFYLFLELYHLTWFLNKLYRLIPSNTLTSIARIYSHIFITHIFFLFHYFTCSICHWHTILFIFTHLEPIEKLCSTIVVKFIAVIFYCFIVAIWCLCFNGYGHYLCL